MGPRTCGSRAVARRRSSNRVVGVVVTVRAVLALVVLDLVLVAPAIVALGGWGAFALGADLLLAVTLALLLPRGGPAGATALWSLWFAFECLRLGSILAMGEEGLLFD